MENEEGWLVCEMTGSVLDSQPIYLLTTTTTTTTCEPDPEEDEMVIPSDKELSDWLNRKCNEVTFQDVNTKLFSEVIPLPEIRQRYMIYCCMSNLWRNDPYFTQFNHRHRYKITKGFMAACWDC